ncbi:MAG: hypothetical protein HOQ05_12560 [Corynebacteriales bacterium]|nr:hypothetical protein [Mycobacteriales bacterium]
MVPTKTGLRIRARRDYWNFVVKYEWPILLTIMGVVLGVVTILPSAAALALSVLALALGITSLMLEYRNLRDRWSSFTFSPVSELFPVHETPSPPSYTEPVRHSFPNRATAITDNAIDRHLRQAAVPALVEDEPYELSASLRATAPQVLGETAQGGVIFNGPVLGLADDPLPTAAAAGRPVRLHKARFFDGQCSNELCRMTIAHRKTGEVLDLRQQVLLDSAGQLAPLAETDLANIVGVSTIAITADQHVVLIEQTAKNSASAALLAPSGSGSLEPVDLSTLSPTWTLQQLLINGMQRELVEECGIKSREIIDTQVVGYGRWLERGAKPEFFGVTRLAIAAEQLNARRVSSAEELYTGGVLSVMLDWSALAEQLRARDDVLAAPACPTIVRQRGSLPLLLALRAAALAIGESTR